MSLKVAALVVVATGFGAAATGGEPPAVEGESPVPASAAALPEEAAPYVGMYQAAANHSWDPADPERKINWYLLASIHMQESKFGTSTLPGVRDGVNEFGCCSGPMQFNVRDGTWDGHKDAYDEIASSRPADYPLKEPGHPSPYDSFDAIAAAAHKLAMDGADESLTSKGTHDAVCAYVGECGTVDECGRPSEYCQVLPRAQAWERASRWPLEGRKGELSSAFGMRVPPVGGGDPRPHKGVDISAAKGTKIVAYADGKVVLRAYDAGGYGNYVCLNHGSFESCYAHMLAPTPRAEGESVVAGDEIGRVGNTGSSTGPHLHFEIREPGFGAALCPAPYLSIDHDEWCRAERF